MIQPFHRHAWLLAAGTILLGAMPAGAQNSPLQREVHVEAAVIGEMDHVQPGVPYRVGLLLRHDPGWHTYWKSTATGYATSIQWSLPEGFSVSGIAWPTPKVYSFEGLSEYVYEGETLLMATLSPPADLAEGEIEIGFTAEWLMCEQVCIPGSVKSVLRLPVRHGPASRSAAWGQLFLEADQQLPAAPDGYSLGATAGANAVVLRVGGGRLPQSLYFFDDQAVFKPWAAPVPVAPGAEAAELRLELDGAADLLPERLTGVLKAAPGWPGLAGRAGIEVNIPVQPAAAAPPPPSWAGLLLLAFMGGLVLNLMPCVFPVLGIKIMGFVSQSGESRGKVVGHGLVFTAGVVMSFWVLAGVLLLLRSGGSQLGWGFQLQSPGFVLMLALLLLAFALNMSGLFEVGQSAVGAGARLTARSGLAGSFFSGVLATVVATPCAAPFLAPALGAALALPPLASFTVFTFIAAGLSTPYLLLSMFPAMIRLLPRPGAWMETFKQAMAFLLYATVAYLLWVLAGQLTEEGSYAAFGLLRVLFSLVVLALALWIYGRWAAFHKPRRTRYAAAGIACLLGLAAVGLGLSGTAKPDADGIHPAWQEWEPGKAEALAGSGKVVYVDFTARWCVTCQTNKAAVFGSAKVRDELRALEVVLFKADWTHQDPRISAALASYGRSAVPFNLVYGPAAQTPLILPEVLTPGVVLEALRTAAGK